MDDRPVLVIADFKVNGGSKNAMKTIVEYLKGKKRPIHLWLLINSVIETQDKEWLKQNSVELTYLPYWISKPHRLLVKCRLTFILHFLYFYKYKDCYSYVIASIERPYSMLIGALVWSRRFVYYQHAYPQGNPRLLSRLFEPLRKLYFKSLTRSGFTFIVGSQWAKRRFQNQFKYSSSKLNIQVIPLPVQINPIEKIMKNQYSVLTLGQIEWFKGPDFWLDVAIAVCQTHSEVIFKWAGRGQMQARLEALIPTQYKNRIMFLGYIPSVVSELSNSDIYFQPSRVENQGLAVIEAMAMGLPCIVSNIGGLPELVEDQVSGYVVDFDVSSIAECIINLFGNSELRKTMGLAGSSKYHQSYTYSSWVTKMESALIGLK